MIFKFQKKGTVHKVGRFKFGIVGILFVLGILLATYAGFIAYKYLPSHSYSVKATLPRGNEKVGTSNPGAQRIDESFFPQEIKAVRPFQNNLQKIFGKHDDDTVGIFLLHMIYRQETNEVIISWTKGLGGWNAIKLLKRKMPKVLKLAKRTYNANTAVTITFVDCISCPILSRQVYRSIGVEPPVEIFNGK